MSPLRNEASDKFRAMREGGKILKAVVEELKPMVREGMSLIDIDRRASQLITQKGGDLSFARVPGYTHATCLSVNQTVVHGVPDGYALKKGDILKLDIGVFHQGYHVDYSDTLPVGGMEGLSADLQRVLIVGKETLCAALPLVKPGVHIGEVSKLIFERIQSAGYHIILELTGHAVGTELHMAPYIPGFLQGSTHQTPLFQPGVAYAIEVIYSLRDDSVVQKKKDGWSLETRSGSQSACFENTVYVDRQKGYVLV